VIQTSSLDRPRRGLSVVFVRYDREKYSEAWADFEQHLHTFASGPLETVIVDNARPKGPAERLEAGLHAISGSNSAWEFSAFDEGIAWLRAEGRLLDLTLLATDAFAAYGGDYVSFNAESVLRFSRDHGAAIGWVDSFQEPCRLFGDDYDSWLRTSYLILPSEALVKVQPFAQPFEDDELFGVDWRSPWKSDAPVSPNLRERIDHWLTGATGIEELAGADTWHSRFDLDAGSFPFFKSKVRAIVSEHHLSVRLRGARVRVFDIREVAGRLVRGDSPELSSAGESLEALERLRSGESDEVLAIDSKPGTRLIFAGDAGRPDHVAAARRFSSQVMPLVLQRFPTATFELLVAQPGLPLADLAGVNNTLIESPDRLEIERAVEVAALVLPGSVSAAAALPPPFNRPKWSGSQRVGMKTREGRFRVGRQETIAIAGRCCEALESALDSRTATATSIGSESLVPAEGDSQTDLDREGQLEPTALETAAFRWRADYRSWREKNTSVLDQREAHEQSLVEGPAAFVVQGLCVLCERETPLHVDFEFGGDALAARPNWRERLVCQACGLNSKMRGLLHVLREIVVPGTDPRILVWESDGHMADALSAKFPKITGIGGDEPLPRGGEGERREGETDLPLFDCLLALDMFEKVRDLDGTISRCLELIKPGGGLAFTASFRSDRERMGESHAEAGEASDVFGWAVLDRFRSGGFEDVVAHFFWSPSFGYLGRGQVVLVARRADLVG